MQQVHIHFSIHGRAGLICFDRPKNLNALSRDMAVALREQLMTWDANEHVSHVVMVGSSPKAFCAGGDVRALYDLLKERKYTQVTSYFQEEYLADLAVFEFSKPIISLVDGIVMGGGAGLMQASSHTVVTENTKFAMPESAIGLFPDAGASAFLGRCPEAVGLFLGMTGKIITGADCFVLGLAHSVTRSSDMEKLKLALLKSVPEEIDAVLHEFRHDPGPSPLQQNRSAIEYIFSDYDPILARDRAKDMATIKDDKFAEEIYQALKTRCPMTIAVFARLMRVNKDVWDTATALMTDFYVATKMTKRSDFCEGIRAVLVDKTNDAVWVPAVLEDVTDALVDDVFDHSGLPPLR